MRAEHAEPLLAEHLHHGSQQPIVAGECRAADAGQNARTLGIRTQIEQRGPPHRSDQHEVPAAMLAQRGDDPAGGEDPHDLVRPGRQHRRVRETLQPDQEHAAPGRPRRRGHLARQPSATCQDAERRADHPPAATVPTPRGSDRGGWEHR